MIGSARSNRGSIAATTPPAAGSRPRHEDAAGSCVETAAPRTVHAVRRVTILAPALAIALLLGVVSSEVGAASRPATTRVLPCLGAPQVRPGKYVLACGDGNFYVSRLRWVRWSASVGIARAQATLNDCRPDCAEGHFHSTSAVLVFSDPVSRRARRLYSVVTVLDATRLPGSSRAVVVQPLPLSGVR